MLKRQIRMLDQEGTHGEFTAIVLREKPHGAKGGFWVGQAKGGQERHVRPKLETAHAFVVRFRPGITHGALNNRHRRREILGQALSHRCANLLGPGLELQISKTVASETFKSSGIERALDLSQRPSQPLDITVVIERLQHAGIGDFLWHGNPVPLLQPIDDFDHP